MRASLDPRIAETHTGLVVLLGDFAYKIKKPVVTDFLDFSTPAARRQACEHEVALNRRLAPASYLGLGCFESPDGGREPVIVMHRHPDDRRLATLVRGGDGDVVRQLDEIAAVLARFHAGAARGPAIDAQATVAAVERRWRENLDELARYAADGVGSLPTDRISQIAALVGGYLAGRAVLFARRIADRRIVDGHADLLADDIFCLPDGPALLDCLEFDDLLRYVDVIDDAAFLAMDLEYLGRPDLAEHFLAAYLRLTGDDAPASLRHFYLAYRAVVRAKVDCVRITQGHPEAGADARRHVDIAAEHLRRGALRLIIVGGAPGTGKSTVARGLADRLAADQQGARVISTDDVRSALVRSGEIDGEPGTLGQGRYSPQNIEAVYAAVLRAAHLALCEGSSVILDGTWQDAARRARAREIAEQAFATVVEIACAAPRDVTTVRIGARRATTSEVTRDIAAALPGGDDGVWPGAHRLDTTRSVDATIAQAEQICLTHPPTPFR